MGDYPPPPPPYSLTPPPVGFVGQDGEKYQQQEVKVTVMGEVPCPDYQPCQQSVVTVQPHCVPPPTVAVIMGASCPVCRAGVLRNEFTGCGICLGICFFPIGLLCCMMMQERRCTHCRMSFGSA